MINDLRAWGNIPQAHLVTRSLWTFSNPYKALDMKQWIWNLKKYRYKRKGGRQAIKAGMLVGILIIVAYDHYTAVKAPLKSYVDKVKVIDGDTIQLGETRIRLFGIDAPEIRQPCLSLTTQTCGVMARLYLENTIIADHEVSCTSHETDKYGRELATCFADGRDISRQMVRGGYAEAYVYFSMKYADDEDFAKSQNLGLWQYGFMNPYEFRKIRN